MEEEGAPSVAELSYPELLQRKRQIEERLAVIAKPSFAKQAPKKKKTVPAALVQINASQLPIVTETSKDVHFDFLLKEMQWLAADFTAERQRHVGLRRRLASGIVHRATQVANREAREMAAAAGKRRKLATKLSREVKGWWNKMDRVIAYKQKMDADQERRKAMNQQLVTLVQQTERYSESLANQYDPVLDDSVDEEEDDDDEATTSEHPPETSGNGRRKGRQPRQQRQRLTVEEALAEDRETRRSKTRVTDYARIALAKDDASFYGESTEDSGSDGSYAPGAMEDDEASDDETTLLEAEVDELRERQRKAGDYDEQHTTIDLEQPFEADPVELRKLREESVMDLDAVLERLRSEAPDDEVKNDTVDMQVAEESETEVAERKSKRVKFREAVVDETTTAAATISAPLMDKEAAAKPKPDPGNDADDDGDASDVEDFVNIDDDDVSRDGSEEFVGQEEPDDETTMAQEESLPQALSAADELKLLQDENDIPVEELRKLYAGALASQEEDEEEDQEEEALDNSDGISKQDISERTATEMTSDLQMMIEEGNDDQTEEAEYQPEAGADVDDETTMEQEEKLGGGMSYEAELELLERENEIPIDQLRAMYATMEEVDAEEIDESMDVDASSEDLEAPASSLSQVLAENDENDETEDYSPDPDHADDETTIEAEERLGRDMSYADEIAQLQREGEMTVEELRALYGGADNEPEPQEEELGDGDEAGEPALADLIAAVDDQENDEDFAPNQDEKDDETTMEAEERLGREMSTEQELAMLQEEGEMSIEALRALYTQTENPADPERVVINDRGKRKRVEASDDEGSDSEGGDAEEAGDDGKAALDALEASAELARKTRASRPFLLSNWVKLREYQQIGLNWLVSLQSRRLNGILADEMGLGKTLQTISLLSYLASYKGIWGPHLIVVPTSVILNWETELKRFSPGLKVLCYYGSAKRRKELRTGWTKSNWYHVVITSYQLAVQDAFAFKRKKWYYLVMDEAQNIKNFQSLRWQTLINFNTQRRLLLTGTPLQNNLMELWSLLHFLMPYIFRSRKEFSYWFANPMNSMVEGTANKNDDIINRLHGILRPFVLRRLKKDVETQMPGKYEHIVKCQLSRRQMFIYEEFMARSATRQALNGGNFMGMMNVLMQLRKVCNHPDLFEPRSVVTPLSLDPLNSTMPSLTLDIVDSCRANSTSPYLLAPLWSGSQGAPSLEAAMRHDSIEADQLLQLEARLPRPSTLESEIEGSGEPVSGTLRELLHTIGNQELLERQERLSSLNERNSWRCRAMPSTYTRRLTDALKIQCDLFESEEHDPILSTPAALLAMRRNQLQRAEDLDDIIKKFVFCVPKAEAEIPRIEGKTALLGTKQDKCLTDMLLEPLEEYLLPFRAAQARLSSFFPDKKLIQFDAGKLQTLAELLRGLKRGGHRVLIFTQMSKMLDILEAFLNLNGHTYLRLDGSTGVDRRQRLMDRFNNDTKVFTFILSTRSGGLGINLTGADTVVFYDSDWNPSMDAQAQDRAHRIGQTRDVHIYRLITEHTIEENILAKAQQKRQLDILVMDRGQFDASQLTADPKVATESDEQGQTDVYTKGGLRAVLGVNTDAPVDDAGVADPVSKEQMESAMAALEDADDVQALRGAQQEVVDELREFDETVEYKKDSDAENDEEEEETKKVGEDDVKAETKAESGDDAEELEKEFAAWQDKVGLDTEAIEASLSSMERYALRFREDVDPFYSIFAIMEQRRKIEAEEDRQDEIDIDVIERQKALEERRAMDDGDLLATFPKPEELIRQRNLYRREKSRLRAKKKRRKLTGENWESRVDALSNHPFWYNVDTGEAVWEKPSLLRELEAYELANEQMWIATPLQPLVRIMEFLSPFPDRMNCARVCPQFQRAASDNSFIRHVYPVEMGAHTRDDRKMETNHYRGIADAVRAALPGDTIELGDGHYWVNSDLEVTVPLRLIGDENNPTNVVVEMSGSLVWQAPGGFCEGVTFRRPKIASADASTCPMLHVRQKGRLDVFQCVLDNDGSTGSSVLVDDDGPKGRWEGVVMRCGGTGLELCSTGDLSLSNCMIVRNIGSGISCSGKCTLKATDSRVERNGGVGIIVRGDSNLSITKCHFDRNEGGLIENEPSCTVRSTNNTCSNVSYQVPPGFLLVDLAPNLMDE